MARKRGMQYIPYDYEAAYNKAMEDMHEWFIENLFQHRKKVIYDDIEILELMLDTTLDEMTELIPNFDRNNLTSRQKLLAFMSVKELYDNRDKYRSDTKTLSAAVSSMLLKEIYGGAAE